MPSMPMIEFSSDPFFGTGSVPKSGTTLAFMYCCAVASLSSGAVNSDLGLLPDSRAAIVNRSLVGEVQL